MFEAVHAEVDGPGNLQEYGTLNMKRKIDPEGLEKRGDSCKKIDKKSTVCFRWAFITSFIILT